LRLFPKTTVADSGGTLLIDGRTFENVLVSFVPETNTIGHQFARWVLPIKKEDFQYERNQRRWEAMVGDHRIILDDLAILDAPRSEGGTVIKMPPTHFSSKCATQACLMAKIKLDTVNLTVCFVAMRRGNLLCE
jgi:hypothetical protein